MESLLITILAGVLLYFKVISPGVFILIAVASMLWMYVGAALYFKFGFLKFYYHDILGWHAPDDSPQYNDGCSQHSKCKHCGNDIMQDSQGNWF